MTDLLLFILSLFLLTAGGEFLVNGSSSLAKRLGLSPMVIGLTIVAFGTSTPELGVSIKASLIGNNDIAVGNVVGSNIFNFLFILGLSSLIAPLEVKKEFIIFDVPVMIIASFLLTLLSLNHQISQLEGLFLMGLGVLYILFLLYNNKKKTTVVSDLDIKGLNLIKSIFFIAIGLGLLVLGSDMLVKSAILAAKYFHVSDRIIGLTIVAAGTSLPELITSLVATYKGEREIAIGNVIGSNILNIFMIVGPSAILSQEGLTIKNSILNFDLPIMLAVALIAWPIMRSGKKIDRIEGSFLVICYIVYTSLLITSFNS